MKLFFFSALILIFCNEITSQNCGKAKGGIGNVIGGSEISKNQYPWITAIMRNRDGKFLFHCGAVVVSKNRLVTAAHCIQDKGSSNKLLPRDIRVVLGGHDLNDLFEIGKEIRSVKRIFVHPDWNPNVISFDADIAILELEHQIAFNNFIQPICLMESFMAPLASSGILIGYGKSEDESKIHENTPKLLNVPIQTQERCFLVKQELAKISSERTFCAGSGNGTGACLGDSGGGLFVKISDVYYLRGIVSSSLRRALSCDVHSYSVYTNVLKFKNFIKFLKVEEDKEDEQCGIMSSSSGLIQKGSFATRKEFPWMAIIDGNFRTSGVLISHKHIASNMSPVRDWDKVAKKWIPAVDVDRIKISLGTVGPNDESEIVTRPETIVFHPEYTFIDGLATINLAVIRVKSYIEFNDNVRPICLWTFSNDLHHISNEPMYVVGYGLGENGLATNAKKYAKMTMIGRDECEESFKKYPNFLENAQTFCVIGSDNGNPCHQDEYLFVKYQGRWYFRAVIALRHFTPSNFKICSVEPILMGDIASRTQWIQNQIDT